MKRQFIYKTEKYGRIKLIDFLSKQLPFLSVNDLKKQLEIKEIKVNGVKASENVFLTDGDDVSIFLTRSLEDKLNTKIDIVFNDDNIVIVNKPILTETETSLKSAAENILNCPLTAVHRLDTNTTGLVIYAKNSNAEKSLLDAFKNNKIKKTYIALVAGKPKKDTAVLRAYHFKDAKKSHCYIYDTYKNGTKKIVTEYKVLSSNGEVSKLQVNIETGRTHQIRAHLSYIGCPIIGDGKYGDMEINKKHNARYQKLSAVSLEFLDLTAPLDYLNGKKIKISDNFNLEKLS